MKSLVILFLFFIYNTAFSQKYADKNFYLLDSLVLENYDSEELTLLKENLKAYHKTSSEIKQITYLSEITLNSNEVDLWPKYNEIIIIKSQKLLQKKLEKKTKRMVLNFLTDAYNDKAYRISEIGEKNEAIRLYNLAIKIAILNKDKRRLLNCYNNLGNVYSVQGNIPNALKYTFKSLKIAEQVKDIEGIAIALGNLGVIYDQQEDFKKAKEYYLKGLEIQKKTGLKSGIATSYNNLGFIYDKTKEYKKSLSYYMLASKIYIEIEEYDGISAAYSNIGSLYIMLKDPKKAFFYFEKAVIIDKKINNKKGLAHSYQTYGSFYLGQNNFKLAKKYLIESIDIAQESGISEVIQASSRSLYSIYAKEKNWEKAFEMQTLYYQLKDSINSQSNQKEAITQSLNYEFDKQKSLAKKENEKKLALAKEKEDKQRLIIIFGILGFIIVCIFSYYLQKRFKISQAQNSKIQDQKEIIEEKQKEINDSINYAKRIQESFLATEDVFQQKLEDYFIFFKPKDIVSGDFYWAHQVENKLYLCVADSTGHGVPGAFMSLLNISLLNEALLSRQLEKPNELLDFVRKILILGLKLDDSGQGGNDGMDCVCICIDFETLKLQYTGANNPLWIMRNNEFIDLKADKMPVGRSPKQEIKFSLQEFQLQKNDDLFLFSDGYQDQFGGEKGKKFKASQLKDILIVISNKSMIEKLTLLNESFEKWKGELDQVDDVCIIGLRI